MQSTISNSCNQICRSSYLAGAFQTMCCGGRRTGIVLTCFEAFLGGVTTNICYGYQDDLRFHIGAEQRTNPVCPSAPPSIEKMVIKLNFIFPVHSRLSAAQDTPTMVEVGILFFISATNPQIEVCHSVLQKVPAGDPQHRQV